MTRAYKSDLRAEQAEITRERVVEALAEQLAEGPAEFSIPRVAERAGVSVRTVYHHFPNRDAQIDAVAAWLEARLVGDEPPPASLDDLVPLCERICRRAYDPANERLVRAQLVPGVADLARRRRKQARDRAVAEILGRVGDPAAGRRAAAALNVLMSAEIGVALQDRFGLAGDDLLRTHLWLLEAAVEAIRRGDLPGARSTRKIAAPQDAAAPTRAARSTAPKRRAGARRSP